MFGEQPKLKSTLMLSTLFNYYAEGAIEPLNKLMLSSNRLKDWWLHHDGKTLSVNTCTISNIFDSCQQPHWLDIQKSNCGKDIT